MIALPIWTKPELSTGVPRWQMARVTEATLKHADKAIDRLEHSRPIQPSDYADPADFERRTAA